MVYQQVVSRFIIERWSCTKAWTNLLAGRQAAESASCQQINCIEAQVAAHENNKYECTIDTFCSGQTHTITEQDATRGAGDDGSKIPQYVWTSPEETREVALHLTAPKEKKPCISIHLESWRMQPCPFTRGRCREMNHEVKQRLYRMVTCWLLDLLLSLSHNPPDVINALCTLLHSLLGCSAAIFQLIWKIPLEPGVLLDALHCDSVDGIADKDAAHEVQAFP